MRVRFVAILGLCDFQFFVDISVSLISLWLGVGWYRLLFDSLRFASVRLGSLGLARLHGFHLEGSRAVSAGCQPLQAGKVSSAGAEAGPKFSITQALELRILLPNSGDHYEVPHPLQLVISMLHMAARAVL